MENIQPHSQATLVVVDTDAAFRRHVAIEIGQNGIPVLCFESFEQFMAGWQETRPGCVLVNCPEGISPAQLDRWRSFQSLNVLLMTDDLAGDCPHCGSASRQSIRKQDCLAGDWSKVMDLLNDAAVRWDSQQRRLDFESRYARLTPREREVYDLLLLARENKQVAAILTISPSTAEKHRLSIMQKMGTDSHARLLRQKVMATGSLNFNDSRVA